MAHIRMASPLRPIVTQYFQSMLVLAALTALITCHMVTPAYSCAIQGVESGECQDPDQVASQMPFCAEHVNYRSCVPKYQGAAVPRWQNFSVAAKDQWVQERFEAEWNIRKMAEWTWMEKGVGEDRGDGDTTSEVIRRFAYGSREETNILNDCTKAYRNLFCWINFPRCDDSDNSLVMCQSACENYFIACDIPRDMWRCGPSELINAYDVEEPQANTQGIYDVYFRSFFPGQPWRANRFEKDNETPIVVCTPSLAGSTPGRLHLSHTAAFVFMILSCLIVL